MGVGVAQPRRKNFKTLEAIELLILNFSVASKAFFRLKQHHPATSVHVQITHFKTWLVVGHDKSVDSHFRTTS